MAGPSALATALTVAAHAGPYEKELELFRENALSRARDFSKKAVRETPSDPEILAYLAHTDLRLQDREDAIELAREARGIDPCCTHAHYVLGRAYNPVFGTWPRAQIDSVWAHVNRAIACDSTDGKFWAAAWNSRTPSVR